MSTPLDPALIARLLKEEEESPTRSRGPKTDPTADRSYSGWSKLPHHICTPDCPHRTDLSNPTARIVKNPATGTIEAVEPGAACWNLNCADDRRDKDPNSEHFDNGIYVVNEVKGQWICRYCYLAEYLL